MTRSHPTIRTLLGYLKLHRTPLFAATAVALVGAAAALSQPMLARQVIEAVQAGGSPLATAALLVLVLTLAAVLVGVQRFILRRAGEDLVLAMRVRIIERLVGMRMDDLDRSRTGDLTSRVGVDTTQVRAALTSGFVDALTGTATAVGAVLLMLVVDPPLLVVTLAAISVMFAVLLPALARIRVLSRRTQDAAGEMTAGVGRILSSLRTVRAARAGARETARLTASARDAHAHGVRLARVEAILGPTAELAIQGAFLAVLGIGGARVAAGSIGIGDLIAFVFLLFLLVQPISAVVEAATAIQTGLGALERIEEVHSLPLEGSRRDGGSSPREPVTTVNSAVLGAVRPGSVRSAPTVAFSAVTFEYVPSMPVLQALTFTARAGARTAVVGPSGAGKSTVLALIERFYDVSHGSVTLDGRDIRDMHRDELRSRIAYVEQNCPVLPGTLRDNLVLAAPDASEAEQSAVLESVNLLHLVERSCGGLGAQVGDGGVLLSGGERQRLAVARALLARPQLLLLDEATASLDAANEASMARALAEAARDMTVLVVTHRLATVVDADDIVVLDQGRAVAAGSHAELMETSELYRDLARSQLLGGPTESKVSK